MGIFKEVIEPFFRDLFYAAIPHRHRRFEHHNIAFMTLVIKVNPKRRGWQKGVLTVLNNCKGLRFKMDQDGLVEISGIADPNRLLQKIGRSWRVKLQWFQFGQCSNNLFMPAKKKSPAREEPTSSNPPYYNFPIDEGAGYGYGYGRGYYPPIQNGYGYHHPPAVQDGYGYHHPPAVQDGYGYHHPPAVQDGYGYHNPLVSNEYHYAPNNRLF